jgi:hypothetical protein
MSLVSSIFFPLRYLAICLVLVAFTINQAISQDQIFGRATVDGANAPETTATYRKALDTFGGPSVFQFATRERTDLGVWAVFPAVEEEGIVLDWNDEKITILRASADEPTSIITRNVLRISHKFRYREVADLQSDFLAGRFQEVLGAAPKVVGSRAEGVKLARWEQKLILAMLVESCKSLERWETACSLFLSLAKESPPDLLAATIPLPWFDSVAEVWDRDRIRTNAVNWLTDQNELVQLLGASWLLDGELRGEAIVALRRLSRDSRHVLVKQFATAQLWRTVPPTVFVERQLEESRRLRDAIFLPAQAGPSLLIAERCRKGNASDLALQEWLRVVTIHPEQNSLANRARKSAIELLRSRNQEDMAGQIETLARKTAE